MVYTYHIVSEKPFAAVVRNPFGDTVFALDSMAIAPNAGSIMSGITDLTSLTDYLKAKGIILANHRLVSAAEAEHYEKNLDSDKFSDGGHFTPKIRHAQRIADPATRIASFIQAFVPPFSYKERSYYLDNSEEAFGKFVDVLVLYSPEPKTAAQIATNEVAKEKLFEAFKAEMKKHGINEIASIDTGKNTIIYKIYHNHV
jgi:hypothetical protein